MIFKYILQFLTKTAIADTSATSQSTKPVRMTPLICSWYSKYPSPSPSGDFANGKLQSLSQNMKKQKRKLFQNKKKKNRQFTTTLILNIFLQLYYAAFPWGLQTNLYKEIISSTIELQPLLREISLPEFRNTIQQSGHGKLHTVGEIVATITPPGNNFYTRVGPGYPDNKSLG